MCQICRQSPCHPRCPNADDPKDVYTCKYCGEPIIEGEKFFKLMLEGAIRPSKKPDIDNVVKVLIAGEAYGKARVSPEFAFA